MLRKLVSQKDVSESNTIMTSLLKCMPASATKRTSCHTTDDENVNRDLYCLSILLSLSKRAECRHNKNEWWSKKQTDACRDTNKNIDFFLTNVIWIKLIRLFCSYFAAARHIHSIRFLSFQKIYWGKKKKKELFMCLCSHCYDCCREKKDFVYLKTVQADMKSIFSLPSSFFLSILWCIVIYHKTITVTWEKNEQDQSILIIFCSRSYTSSFAAMQSPNASHKWTKIK